MRYVKLCLITFFISSFCVSFANALTLVEPNFLADGTPINTLAYCTVHFSAPDIVIPASSSQGTAVHVISLQGWTATATCTNFVGQSAPSFPRTQTLICGDVNRDGEVSIEDSTMIRKRIGMLPVPIPTCLNK